MVLATHFDLMESVRRGNQGEKRKEREREE
jgi:hypothetical protein